MMIRLAGAVLEDSNAYIPMDSGNLRDSGCVRRGEGGGAKVAWTAPYAGEMYRGVTAKGQEMQFSADKNPRAQKEWFEAAKAVNEGWEERAGRLYGGEAW